MPLLKNKFVLLVGAIIGSGGYIAWFYLTLDKVFNIIFLKSDSLEVSYSFATIPIQIWISSIFFLSVVFLLSNGRFKLSGVVKNNYMSKIPIFALSLSFLLGVIFKPLMVDHLINNGYQLEQTIKASKPWFFDKKIYVKPSSENKKAS